MHSGENYRKIQEERELIDRALPTQHDRKVKTLFPSTERGRQGGEADRTWRVVPAGLQLHGSGENSLSITKHCQALGIFMFRSYAL